MYRPLLEKTKGTNEGKSQVLSRFFHLYQCTSENDFHLHGIFLSYIGASGGTRINTGFFVHSLISLSQARGQRVLCCPKRGTYVPPFFGVWEGRGAGARWAPSSADRAGRRDLRPLQPRDRRAPPYNPQLLKKLAKLLLVSPKPERGPLVRRSQPAPAPLSAGLGCRLGRS